MSSRTVSKEAKDEYQELFKDSPCTRVARMQLQNHDEPFGRIRSDAILERVAKTAESDVETMLGLPAI